MTRYDEYAERAVLSTALLDRRTVERVVAELSSADFYVPKHGNVFAAIESLYLNGYEVDVGTVVDQLRQDGTLDDVGGHSALQEILTDAPGSYVLPTYVSIVRRESRARAALSVVSEARSALDEMADPGEVLDQLSGRLGEIDRAGQLPDEFYESALDFTESAPASAVPLIEGVLYQRTRVIVLAGEKAGKSWLLRQLAFCAAAGIHPFTFRPMDPVRVLLLDAENDADELVPSIRQIRASITRSGAGDSPAPSLLTRPYGMDLRTPRDRGDLEAVLSRVRPQLIVGGPVYKLLPRDRGEDVDIQAAALHRILDDIRKRWGCAIVMEHHAPTGKQGVERELRSKGGQQWAAWPEVTVSLRGGDRYGVQSLNVGFPHPPRGSFRWPRRFDRGRSQHEWPWAAVWGVDDERPTVPPRGPLVPSALLGRFDEEPF